MNRNMSILALVLLATGAALGEAPRETVLDRKVHVEEGVLQVPDVAPLCDTLGLEKRRIQVGGCQLYCETEGGGGPALVLINGGPGGTHHCFHPYFGRASEFARVIYYDQRGCGQSDYAKGSGYTIAQAVEDLDKVRQALGLDRWVLLGWSYGGALAQCYAVKHAERVAGLVLVGASPDALRLSLAPTRQFEALSGAEREKIRKLSGNRALTLAQLTFNNHLNGDWKRQNFFKPTTEQLARMALYEWKHDPEFRNSISQDLRHIDLRGLFDGCPIPVLLMEGAQDLTWGTDKPGKLQACFPGSKLILFERSAHGPFMDEPNLFFSALLDFLKGLAKQPADVARWKAQVAAREATREKSPEHLLRTLGWGRKSSARIAGAYSESWLKEISDPVMLLRLGFALYDARRNAEALAVFERMEKCGGADGVALVWQGHILDLLEKRQEALSAYAKAAALDPEVRHDQYGIVLTRQYAQERMKTPFVRVENHSED